MASPVDILLVGYGAVGAICECSLYRDDLLRSSAEDGRLDAYILIQSQRAHVTVVARGNFDAVQGR
jgi:hypothetical protein